MPGITAPHQHSSWAGSGILVPVIYRLSIIALLAIFADQTQISLVNQ
jgi:hypothetical protein